MTADDGPSNTKGPPPPVISRGERLRLNGELLEAAAAAPGVTERRELLADLARLNLDLVEALTMAAAKRYRGTRMDRDALLAHVIAAYTERVVALELPLERDFVVWVAPVVRGAIVDYIRLVPA